METHSQISNHTPNNEFSPGSSVVYAMHGKCNIISIEDRQVSGQSIRFYKLMVQKPTLSRTTRQDPAIWVPISSAREQGMRSIMTQAEVDGALKILSNREYYFSAAESFSAVQPKLEVTIRNEGGIGLAKTLSYLFVLKRKQIVPSPEVNKMYESVLRLLLREISEILGETSKALEEKINKGLRHKLIPDA